MRGPRRIAAVIAVAAVLIGIGVTLIRRDGDDLSRARGQVQHDAGWDTAAHAGETLATVGEELLGAGDKCGTGPHCDDLLSASGWAQVAAVRVLRCTRPGIFDTRSSARELLTQLDKQPDRRVNLPPVPRC